MLKATWPLTAFSFHVGSPWECKGRKQVGGKKDETIKALEKSLISQATELGIKCIPHGDWLKRESRFWRHSYFRSIVDGSCFSAEDGWIGQGLSGVIMFNRGPCRSSSYGALQCFQIRRQGHDGGFTSRTATGIAWSPNSFHDSFPIYRWHGHDQRRLYSLSQ